MHHRGCRPIQPMVWLGMGGIWFFLNGDRGIASFNAVRAAGIDVEAIIVPARKKDVLALQLTDAKVIGVENVNDPNFVKFLARQAPSIGVVAGYSTIFKTPLIDAFRDMVLNLHAGHLPYYRGGSPLNWQLINGERDVGISIIRMTEGIDSGPVMNSLLIPIKEDDDIALLHAKANELFGPLLVSILLNRPDGHPQDESKARYWLQRSDADSDIRWSSMTARQVHNFVRGICRPYPGARSGSLRIWKTSLDVPHICGNPGRVAFVQGHGPLVCCSDRAIKIIDYTGDMLRQGQYC